MEPKRTLESVVGKFVAGLDARLEAIERAYGIQDWDELAMLSHKLAGAALFGFPELGVAAHQLEGAVKARKLEEIPVLIASLAKQRDLSKSQTSL